MKEINKNANVHLMRYFPQMLDASGRRSNHVELIFDCILFLTLALAINLKSMNEPLRARQRANMFAITIQDRI